MNDFQLFFDTVMQSGVLPVEATHQNIDVHNATKEIFPKLQASDTDPPLPPR